MLKVAERGRDGWDSRCAGPSALSRSDGSAGRFPYVLSLLSHPRANLFSLHCLPPPHVPALPYTAPSSCPAFISPLSVAPLRGIVYRPNGCPIAGCILYARNHSAQNVEKNHEQGRLSASADILDSLDDSALHSRQSSDSHRFDAPTGSHTTHGSKNVVAYQPPALRRSRPPAQAGATLPAVCHSVRSLILQYAPTLRAKNADCAHAPSPPVLVNTPVPTPYAKRTVVRWRTDDTGSGFGQDPLRFFLLTRIAQAASTRRARHALPTQLTPACYFRSTCEYVPDILYRTRMGCWSAMNALWSTVCWLSAALKCMSARGRRPCWSGLISLQVFSS